MPDLLILIFTILFGDMYRSHKAVIRANDEYFSLPTARVIKGL